MEPQTQSQKYLIIEVTFAKEHSPQIKHGDERKPLVYMEH